MRYRFTWHQKMSDLPRTEWDRLADSAPPFYEWDWLESLERAGCAEADKGWHPHHLACWLDQELVGVAPLYLKDHSRGEFVFDQEWAQVAYRVGVDYYPKLLGMSPSGCASRRPRSADRRRAVRPSPCPWRRST